MIDYHDFRESLLNLRTDINLWLRDGEEEMADVAGWLVVRTRHLLSRVTDCVEYGEERMPYVERGPVVEVDAEGVVKVEEVTAKEGVDR